MVTHGVTEGISHTLGEYSVVKLWQKRGTQTLGAKYSFIKTT
jgi:hypothetical protein